MLALVNATGPELIFCKLFRGKFNSRQQKSAFGVTLGIKLELNLYKSRRIQVMIFFLVQTRINCSAADGTIYISFIAYTNEALVIKYVYTDVLLRDSSL